MRHLRAILLQAAIAAALSLAACSPGTLEPVRTYNMGDRVDLGHLVYIVFETQWLTHIGEGPDARTPQNRFFVVRISAANSQPTAVMVPGVSVEDDSGHSYPELRSDVGAPHWLGFLRNVMPNDSLQGNVVFDAPPGHYKMKVADQTSGRIAYIDIPLSFGAEIPDVTIPGKARPPSMPAIRSPGGPTTPKKQ